MWITLANSLAWTYKYCDMYIDSSTITTTRTTRIGRSLTVFFHLLCAVKVTNKASIGEVWPRSANHANVHFHDWCDMQAGQHCACHVVKGAGKLKHAMHVMSYISGHCAASHKHGFEGAGPAILCGFVRCLNSRDDPVPPSDYPPSCLWPCRSMEVAQHQGPDLVVKTSCTAQTTCHCIRGWYSAVSAIRSASWLYRLQLWEKRPPFSHRNLRIPRTEMERHSRKSIFPLAGLLRQESPRPATFIGGE